MCPNTNPLLVLARVDRSQAVGIELQPGEILRALLRGLHHRAAAAVSWSFTTRQNVRTARLLPSKKSSKKPTAFNGAG